MSLWPPLVAGLNPLQGFGFREAILHECEAEDVWIPTGYGDTRCILRLEQAKRNVTGLQSRNWRCPLHLASLPRPLRICRNNGPEPLAGSRLPHPDRSANGPSLLLGPGAQVMQAYLGRRRQGLTRRLESCSLLVAIVHARPSSVHPSGAARWRQRGADPRT